MKGEDPERAWDSGSTESPREGLGQRVRREGTSRGAGTAGLKRGDPERAWGSKCEGRGPERAWDSEYEGRGP